MQTWSPLQSTMLYCVVPLRDIELGFGYMPPLERSHVGMLRVDHRGQLRRVGPYDHVAIEIALYVSTESAAPGGSYGPSPGGSPPTK